MTDNFFTPVANTKPYFKVAFEGFAGSGKTYTSALVSIGLHKKIKSKKPVIMFDTEKAAKFLIPLYAKEKIELKVKESHSLADLKEAMRLMKQGAGDILIIDSISHVWADFLSAYQKKVGRNALQIQDWGIIKPTWRQDFSVPFVNDPYHIVMCGRAGDDLQQEVNEYTGKKELVKVGIKMNAEKDTAFEPDLLASMEQVRKITKKGMVIITQAMIKKDRSTLLHGKTIENPTFKDFEPVIDVMLNNPFPKDAVVTPEQDAGILFKTEEEKYEWRKERDKWIEEIDGLLIRIAPGATGKDKQLKLDLLDAIFGTTSETAIHEFMPEKLKEGYKQLIDKAVEIGAAEWFEKQDGQKGLRAKKSEK